MTPNQQREELSKAYVTAVTAKCGFKLFTWSQDDDCLDVTIGAAGILGRGTLAGPKLDLQLKSSSNPRHDRDTEVAWSLSRRHYERLRASSCTPVVLVVVVLPEDPTLWLVHSPDELVLRRCGYWYSLRDEPDLNGDHASTTILVPRRQVFSPDELTALMTRISAGEHP